MLMAYRGSNQESCAYAREVHYLLSYTPAWECDHNASKKGELTERASIYGGPTQARVQVQHMLQYLTFNFGLGFQCFLFLSMQPFFTQILKLSLEKSKGPGKDTCGFRWQSWTPQQPEQNPLLAGYSNPFLVLSIFLASSI